MTDPTKPQAPEGPLEKLMGYTGKLLDVLGQRPDEEGLECAIRVAAELVAARAQVAALQAEGAWGPPVVPPMAYPNQFKPNLWPAPSKPASPAVAGSSSARSGQGVTDVTHEQFIEWFHSLDKQQRVNVWYDCECLTRGEFDELTAKAATRVLELQARIHLLAAAVGAADRVRSWYDKQMGPYGPEGDFDTARAACGELEE